MGCSSCDDTKEESKEEVTVTSTLSKGVTDVVAEGHHSGEHSQSSDKEIDKEDIDPEKAAKSGKIFIWGIVIVIIAVFLIFGYKAINNEPNYPTLNYNNFEFVEIDNTWHTQWKLEDELFTLSFRFNPEEVEDLTIQGKLNESFNRKIVYVTFDPTKDANFSMLALAAADLALSMHKALGKEVIAACAVNGTDDCIDRPIVTCNDQNKSVLFLRESESTRITLNQNCIIIQGKGFEIVKAADRLLYQWYGIMG